MLWFKACVHSSGQCLDSPCLSRGKTQYGTIFFLNLNLQEHAGTVICMWYSWKKLFILWNNPKQIRSGASVLHLIFLHPIKTLFSAKLDFKPVIESLVVACSCTSRRADRPMHKDDQLTAFRGVSDSVQHVSFAYISQWKSFIYFILGVKRKFPQHKFWVNTFLMSHPSCSFIGRMLENFGIQSE